MMEDEDKKTGELLPFRDLSRGFRLDEKTSVAAVRQMVTDIPSLDEKVKPETEERFYDVLAEKRSCLHQTGY